MEGGYSMEKKTYEAPEVTKVEFDYSERIAADSSGVIGSGDSTGSGVIGSGTIGGFN